MIKAEAAIIGGSSTNSINFPQDVAGFDNIKVLEEQIIMETPFGTSPPLTLFQLGGKNYLTVKFHGWRPGVSRGRASQQLFWVFKEAGVKEIISEGGVGAVNHLLNPRDLLLPTDYIDLSMRKDVSISSDYLLIMRQPVCPRLHDKLFKAAQEHGDGYRVFDRGIYAVTDGRHFESVAEVNMIKQHGADVVGQSMCPEVYLAREIGACYGRIDMVVNYAEGVVTPWQHEELKDIFYGQSQRIAKILLQAAQMPDMVECRCQELRKETLINTKGE